MLSERYLGTSILQGISKGKIPEKSVKYNGQQIFIQCGSPLPVVPTATYYLLGVLCVPSFHSVCSARECPALQKSSLGFLVLRSSMYRGGYWLLLYRKLALFYDTSLLPLFWRLVFLVVDF